MHVRYERAFIQIAIILPLYYRAPITVFIVGLMWGSQSVCYGMSLIMLLWYSWLKPVMGSNYHWHSHLPWAISPPEEMEATLQRVCWNAASTLRLPLSSPELLQFDWDRCWRWDKTCFMTLSNKPISTDLLQLNYVLYCTDAAALTRYLSEETLTSIKSSPTRTFSPSDLCLEAGCTVHQHASPEAKQKASM